MKTLKFLGQNIVYSILGTIVSFMLRFYEPPEYGDIVGAVMLQMVRNYVIIFIIITVARLAAPYIRNVALKWDRKKAERYEKLMIGGLYAGAFLIAYLLIKSIGPGVPVH